MVTYHFFECNFQFSLCTLYNEELNEYYHKEYGL